MISRRRTLQDQQQSLRDRQARWQLKTRAAANEIGDLPEVVNPKRKESCRRNLRKFLVTYFPGTTGLSPFSVHHKKIIKRIEACILKGGRFVNCVYRGFAKTTISENAIIWAAVYGHRKFACIFGADATSAQGNVDSIKGEFEENDLLLEDFPEVCFPIRQLEGRWQRAATQKYFGVSTNINWTADKIVLPTIDASDASGIVIVAKGITAVSRGMKHKVESTGEQRRPDFVMLDDPQTDESARSEKQTHDRMNLIKRNILKMAGHNRTIACVVNATVIEQEDLVDQLLDHEKNPAWQSERIKMVDKWADRHDDLWLRDYAALRHTYDKDKPGDQLRAWKEATKFYRDNRTEMDAGCIVSWKHCYDRELEVSAIQHAYNHLIDDGDDVFNAEYQNDPAPQVEGRSYLKAHEICEKVNGLEKREVPKDVTKITSFIDVQGQILFYVICGWNDDFTGYIMDYGTYPQQPTRYFTVKAVRRKLENLAAKEGAVGLEGRLSFGLRVLTNAILGAPFTTIGGVELMVDLLMIDASWGESTDAVYTFVRDSPHRNIILPSHGRFYGASTEPLTSRNKLAYHRKKGNVVGLNWLMPRTSAREIPHVTYDTNFWKTFFHQRLATPLGEKGCLSLFKANPYHHRLFADQCSSEFPVKTFGRGREVDEWKPRPFKPDNHYLDCAVGCCVGASIKGASIMGEKQDGRRPRKKVRIRSA